MDPEDRLRRLETALVELAEAARAAPVVVEGLSDAAALRSLGVEGEILVYNTGRSMPAFADAMRERPRLIVLFDWDRKGGHLTRLLREQLGQHKLDLRFRKEFAQVSLVKCVEDLPAARRDLRGRVERERPH
jgi:5S rRNA maturation endonuclease (ribonuclease M5)